MAIALAVLALYFAGVLVRQRFGVRVDIYNESGEILSGIRIEVESIGDRGKIYELRDLPPNRNGRVYVRPITESHIDLEFSSSDKTKHRETVFGYAEHGSCGSAVATVRRNSRVESSDRYGCYGGAGALIVGFNLPFDISRIAVRWTTARNGGFSFVLSQLTKKGVENHHRPRVRIAPLNGVAEKIELTAVRRNDEQHRWRRDRFLDLHTLAFALTDKSYSLSGAIEAFGSKVTKMEHEPTGKITDKEIRYGRRDVRGTLGLLNAMKREYDLHPIRLRPYRAYSPASIGKAYLRAMGIEEPLAKFRSIPARMHGIAMSAYFGGRAECRIRRWPVPVVPVDLTSEYPSVDALLGIWNILTAQRLEIGDATEEVRRVLKSIRLERLFQPSFWKKLNFYASVIPEGDVVPVRTIYGSNGGSCNIGLNELHWKQNLWLAGPDLVSAVLNGRIPNVRKAFRIVPRGKQRGLKTIELRGAIPVDPRKEDFFTRVIEYRKQNKNNDQLQYFLKILANSI